MKYCVLVLALVCFAVVKSQNGRVTGGDLAEEGQFPFAVSFSRNGKHTCGGTILNNQWILTAAHCIKTHPIEEMDVLVGTTRRSEGGVSYSVELAIMHDKEWDAANFGNDIALLKIHGTIHFDNKTAPVKLTSKEIQPDTPVTLCGWGRTTEDGHSVDDLHFVELKTITQERCQEKHKHKVREYMMCTFTKKGEGSCKGDSGSSLLYDGAIVGISSWGKHCGGKYPNVYTRVGHFLDWIENTIANNS